MATTAISSRLFVRVLPAASGGAGSGLRRRRLPHSGQEPGTCSAIAAFAHLLWIGAPHAGQNRLSPTQPICRRHATHRRPTSCAIQRAPIAELAIRLTNLSSPNIAGFAIDRRRFHRVTPAAVCETLDRTNRPAGQLTAKRILFPAEKSPPSRKSGRRIEKNSSTFGRRRALGRSASHLAFASIPTCSALRFSPCLGIGRWVGLPPRECGGASPTGKAQNAVHDGRPSGVRSQTV